MKKLFHHNYLMILITILLITEIQSNSNQSQKIMDAINSNKWSEANQLLEKYHREFPEQSWVYSTHSWVLENLKEYDKAILICENGLQKFPQESKIKAALARVLIKKASAMADPRAAHAFFLRAAKLDLRDYTEFELAKSYRNLGEFSQADLLMQKGLKQYPQADYFQHGFAYTRYLWFKATLLKKDLKEIRSQVDFAKDNLNIQLPLYKQFYFNQIISQGLRTLEDRNFFETTFQFLKKKFSHDPQIFDEYGFQLYANYRTGGTEDKLLRDNAISFRRKAFNLIWQKKPMPASIKNLEFPLKGRYVVWSEFGGTAMTHNGFANFCYDFAAVDQEGRNKNPQTDARTNQAYYMFGKPVYAVRNGVVSSVLSQFKDNLPGGYAGEANTVTIEHEGFSSFYTHLRENGVVVSEGQKVKSGQLLGYVGNSGMSSESHLHFCIYEKSDAWLSIPFEFKKTKIQVPNGTYEIKSRPFKEGEIVFFE